MSPEVPAGIRVRGPVEFEGPVHTYPDNFESATFSFRIRLLENSTANPDIFKFAL